MTTIKNKQTGETLTGRIDGRSNDILHFVVSGCKSSNIFTASEWEILPPPLPTGIGAVVRVGHYEFVRIHGPADSQWCWLRRSGGMTLQEDSEVLALGNYITLSEGVQV